MRLSIMYKYTKLKLTASLEVKVAPCFHFLYRRGSCRVYEHLRWELTSCHIQHKHDILRDVFLKVVTQKCVTGYIFCTV
jgi:hypothetical protein